MESSTDVLIIGAGPFGLAVAAGCGDRGVDHLVVGETMGFWRDHMPDGMLLRSGPDWHLDPGDRDTMERFLEEGGTEHDLAQPLARTTYLAYVEWFRRKRGIVPLPVHVERLDLLDGGSFRARLAGGGSISARRVVLALGIGAYAHVPPEVTALVPEGRAVHTCNLVEFGHLRGRRCLIVGGRQSAFEWAALMRESGVAEVHVVYRHPTPAFVESDWAWVSPLVDGMLTNPGWYRSLSPAAQQAIGQRLWGEGRLKLEPWLEPRVRRDGVTLWPETTMTACHALPSGALSVRLGEDAVVDVDEVVLATGYKVDIARDTVLANGNLLPRIDTRNGYPVLDERFHTSVSGLHMTSVAAGQDFGPFLRFTVSARVSARLISAALA